LGIKLKKFKTGVIGAGAWGTAIARLLSKNGLDVKIWCHSNETAKDILNNQFNSYFLPDVPLPESIEPTIDLIEVVKNCHILVSAVPSHVTRKIAKKMRPEITSEHIVVILSKGIEENSLSLMSQIFEEELDNLPKIAVLSGPTFAQEIALDLPAAALLACNDEKTRMILKKIFHSKNFRLYFSTDMVGVQLGGAIKNIIAIASGIADGMNLGLNARAALICRGVAEMSRLGTKMGGSPDTFSGMSGLGDLILTSTGNLSRNHSLGYKLGKGITPKEFLNQSRMVVEGLRNAVTIKELGEFHKIEMPICNTVFQILYKGISCSQALKNLLERDPTDE